MQRTVSYNHLQNRGKETKTQKRYKEEVRETKLVKKVLEKIKKEAVLLTMIVLLVLSFITFYRNQVLQNRILELADHIQEQVEELPVLAH